MKEETEPQEQPKKMADPEAQRAKDEARKKEIDSAQELNEKVNEGAEIPTRRVRMLMVNPTDFAFLFTKGLTFRKRTSIIEGVPSDAKVLTVAADAIRGGIMLVVESSEYDEIKINVMPPIQVVKIKANWEDVATKKKKPLRKK